MNNLTAVPAADVADVCRCTFSGGAGMFSFDLDMSESLLLAREWQDSPEKVARTVRVYAQTPSLRAAPEGPSQRAERTCLANG